MAEVKRVAAPRMELGEGPHWDPTNQCLLFVDIMKGYLHRHFPTSGRNQHLKIEGGDTGSSVSFAVPVEGHPDLVVVGHGRTLALVQWPASGPDELTTTPRVRLHAVDDQHPTNRFNDGKCDPRGRLWAGTMGKETAPAVLPPGLGGLYSLGPDLSLAKKVDKVTLSNGLGWSPDHSTMYFVDSIAYCLYAFDYDDSTGSIGGRRTLLDFKAESSLEKAVPDGLCVDDRGHVWLACFFGQKVLEVDPQGRVVREVAIPTPNVTSVCWGGEQYDTLYVTTAQMGLSADQLASDHNAGAVFAVTGLGARGLPAPCFSIRPEILKEKLAA